ncbi:MAG: threonine ammonia-lyase IlvA [Gordonia sp. (in: high G+C Gram-positive bacteria)]|uniref:threonine ammonia-lyase IlvA n=1 Tax=Gordonia sp. (in: high G+C Gram-positive bacteria) TaxID=84139 RepID=UPI0039E66FAD
MTDAPTQQPASADQPALPTVADIGAAAGRIEGAAIVSPLEYCPRLSNRYGVDVYLKREDLQPVRSYKIRGAYNVMAQLSAAERACGVVAASAGNHAQGVAFACKTMGVRGRIYVPTTTPKQKCDRILWHGGDFVELVKVGDTYDAAQAAALDDVAKSGAAWIHPFDDPRTAAGQGTIAREIVEQLGTVPDLTVVPVGGGGCLTGILTYLRATDPGARILGVEPAGAPSLAAALRAGGPVTLDDIDSFVDGAAVRRIGALAHVAVADAGPTVVEHGGRSSGPSKDPRVRVVPPSAPLADGELRVTEVDEGAICSTMLELYQNEGLIAEPAGALAATALDDVDLAGSGLREGASVVVLVSGGNNDVSRYGEIIERSLVHRGIKHYFLVDFPQEPGALRRFLDDVLGPEDDITLFEYVKRNNRETGAALVGVELGSPDGLGPLIERMDESRLRCQRLDPDSPEYRYLT